jgi:wyosine [tRNA(Phe)-imidazoG37] synthetase (radical SAM superfamily)
MYKHLFGPVPSRRLGMSLGVDLVPHKICTLDCVYCECGVTNKLTMQRKEYILFERVTEELKEYFENSPKPDYITLTGSGEPTLNSRIGEIIDYIKGNFDVKVAVLTNGTLLWMPEVRKEISKADLVLPSFDAAVFDDFQKINKPTPELNLQTYLQGIIDFRKEYKGQIWLEILILPGFNDCKTNIVTLKHAILQIKPDRVQVNTLDRPGTIDNLRAATLAELNYIVEKWNLPNVEIVSKITRRSDMKGFRSDIETAILETIERRPCTLEDLEQITGLHFNELNKYLSILENEQKIRAEKQERGFFYMIRK